MTAITNGRKTTGFAFKVKFVLKVLKVWEWSIVLTQRFNVSLVLMGNWKKILLQIVFCDHDSNGNTMEAKKQIENIYQLIGWLEGGVQMAKKRDKLEMLVMRSFMVDEGKNELCNKQYKLPEAKHSSYYYRLTSYESAPIKSQIPTFSILIKKKNRKYKLYN